MTRLTTQGFRDFRQYLGFHELKLKLDGLSHEELVAHVIQQQKQVMKQQEQVRGLRERLDELPDTDPRSVLNDAFFMRDGK
jgi:uncharacterized coiled-coil protein SlyX